MATRMSTPTEILQLRPELRLDDQREGYVAALSEASGAEPVVAIRIPRGIVDRVVLAAAELTLELRADGSVAVYADAIDLGTITSAPLAQLVAEALALFSPEDAVEELAVLEKTLEQALAIVRQERDKLEASA